MAHETAYSSRERGTPEEVRRPKMLGPPVGEVGHSSAGGNSAEEAPVGKVIPWLPSLL